MELKTSAVDHEFASNGTVLNLGSVYRPELDGMRALAVLAVIVNHFDRGLLQSGYLGVDIFFVISGYVITSSLLGYTDATLKDFLWSFYVRRMKRLLPALVFFIVVSSVIICVLNPTPNDSLRTGIAALFGVSNLRLLAASTDYFAESSDLNGFTHTWSLGVEEQFYFLFPLLVWLLAHGRANARSLFRLTVAAVIISALSLAGYVVFSRIYPAAAYFLMPTRLWELGAGCGVYLVGKRGQWFAALMRSVPPSAALAGLLLTLLLPQALIVEGAISAVFFTAILIATLRPETPTYRLFTRPDIMFIGLMSYSLYLWHWGVLSISRLTIGVSWYSLPFQAAAILGLSYVSYRFVEKPLRRADWNARGRLAIALGLSAPVLASLLLLSLTGPLSGQIFLGRFFNFPTPGNLQKTWWLDKQTGKYLETCHVQNAFSTELMKTCLEVPRGKNGTVYLIGDSFARNYLPAVRGAFTDHAVAYMTMGGGCAFLPPSLAGLVLERRCDDYVTQTSAFILNRVQAGDVVVVGQRITEARSSPEYVGFIESFASALSEKDIPTVLLDGTVPPRLLPQECVPYPWIFSERDGCSIGLSAVVNAFPRFEELVNKAAAENRNLYYAPLRTGLCRGNKCGQNTVNGTPIWHDPGHITEESASELSALLRAQLTRNGFFQKYPMLSNG